MVGSLQHWLSTPRSQKGSDGAGLRSAMEDERDKARDGEWRSLLALARRYVLPVNEVRDIKREFDDFSSDGTGKLSREEFLNFVRKRADIPEDEDIPQHLLHGISKAEDKIG